MIRTRNGLKAIGLCVLALGMMAFAATSAQAEPGSEWDVGGATLGSQPELLPVLGGELEPLTPEGEGHGVLLGNIEGFKIEILCTSAELNNAHLIAGGHVNEGADVTFKGCVLKEEGGEVLEACEPNAGGTNPGVVLTQEGHALLELHEGVGITRLLPDKLIGGEQIFAYVETGEECAFGTKIPIGGELTLIDCEGNLEVEQVIHLVEEGPLSNLWVLNPEFEASLDGSALVFLTGAHENVAWSGLPN